MRCHRALSALFCVLSAVGSAAADDLRDVFTLVSQSDPAWTASVRAQTLDHATWSADTGWYPQLTLSLKGVPTLDQTGPLPSFPSPSYSTLTYPVTGVVNGTLPLYDPAVAGKVALGKATDEVSKAKLRETNDGLFADFLASLGAVVLTQGLADIRSETEASFQKLQETAERRLQLGDGSSTDVLRATVAARQAKASSDKTSRQIQSFLAGWPAPARKLFDERGGLTRFGNPGLWIEAFKRWGLDVSFLFADEGAAGAPVPPLPGLLPLDSDVLDRKKAAQEIDILNSLVGPSVDLFGEVDVIVTPDSTFATTWESIPHVGVQLQWPVIGKDTASPVHDAQRLAVTQRMQALDDAERARELQRAGLEQEWEAAVALLRLNTQTRQIADQYAESLRSELTAGT